MDQEDRVTDRHLDLDIWISRHLDLDGCSLALKVVVALTAREREQPHDPRHSVYFILHPRINLLQVNPTQIHVHNPSQS